MKKLIKEEFIKKAEEIHGNKYDYRLVNYVGSKTKVIIVCNVHGKFEQTPNNHLRVRGCPECGILKTSESKLLNSKDFIEKSIKIHGDRYDYSIVDYVHGHTKVDIICREHGLFSIAPHHHTTSKSGCPKCAEYSKGWNYSKWEDAGSKSLRFDSFKLYIIKCYNDNEIFYKIGKTFWKINKRFKGKFLLPYKFDILKVIEGSARDISNMERELHKENKLFKYTPKIEFGGMGECFSKIVSNGN